MENGYQIILYFIIISFLISGILVLASLIFTNISNTIEDSEKVTIYECGFDPFSDSRQKFEVRFFLVGILFIIFDLEISFIFPWVISLYNLPIIGFWSLYIFLLILTLGFIYEWLKGGLEWE
jgi:NADH-quinone oxidoreductase subunit A